MGRARSLRSAQQSICLSCHDGHLSCPQSVWEEFVSLLREEAREGEKEGGRKERRGTGERGREDGKGASLGKMEKRTTKEKGWESVWIAHRLRGLCAGPGDGLSGPLVFFCSLALRKKQMHSLIRLLMLVCLLLYMCGKPLSLFNMYQYHTNITNGQTGNVTQQTRCISHPAHTRLVLLLFSHSSRHKERLAGQARHLNSPCHVSQNMPPGRPLARIAPLSVCQSCKYRHRSAALGERHRDRQGGREGRREREREGRMTIQDLLSPSLR